MNHEKISTFLNEIPLIFEFGDPDIATKTLEQSNLASLMQVYQTIVSADLAGYFNSLTEDVTLEIVGPKELGFTGHWEGRDAVLQATLQNFGKLEEIAPEVTSVVAQGDTVIVIAKESGRIRETEQSYVVHWVQQFTFREGKLARIWEIGETLRLAPAESTLT
jgi:ketosteroid isomerase-like protein